jgi:hypothetical protein
MSTMFLPARTAAQPQPLRDCCVDCGTHCASRRPARIAGTPGAGRTVLDIEALVVGLDDRVEEVLEVVVRLVVAGVAADERGRVHAARVDGARHRPLGRALRADALMSAESSRRDTPRSSDVTHVAGWCGCRGREGAGAWAQRTDETLFWYFSQTAGVHICGRRASSGVGTRLPKHTQALAPTQSSPAGRLPIKTQPQPPPPPPPALTCRPS